jgi:hypothetical protein
MKEDIINIIKILGIGTTELVLDINIGILYINSVEFREPDEVILHSFEGYDMDIEIDFDDLDLKSKRHIWTLLSILLYN